MKTSYSLFNFLFLLGGFIACGDGEVTTEKEIVSPFQEVIYELSWESPEWNKKDNVAIVKGNRGGSENQMSVVSKWNRDSLYFFFKVEDTCLRAYQVEKDHPKLFLDDMVEVLIDTKNNKDSCWAVDDIVYHINLLKVKKDDRGTLECETNPLWDGKAGISAHILGTVNDTLDADMGYIITLSLPWSELELKGEPGLIMGVNFANGDNDGIGRQLFDWVGAWPMRSPYIFGDLKLTKEKIY